MLTYSFFTTPQSYVQEVHEYANHPFNIFMPLDQILSSMLF